MQQDVSIHTRHYWRVKLYKNVSAGVLEIVSIHTRHYWRVKPPAAKPKEPQMLFQSTPAITGG